MNRRCFYIAILASIAVSILIPASACQPQVSGAGNFIVQAYNGVREWFIMQGAGDRIEKIRRGDGVIQVLDENNVPVRGARVYYEQQSHDFLFGTGLAPLAENGPTAVNQDWAEALSALFNYGTAPFYWDSYEAQQGRSSAIMLEMVADWCEKRGITVKGHPLIWAESVPGWAPVGPDDMQKAQEKRVKEIAGEFCGTIDYWDVVNEPTMGAQVSTRVGKWMSQRTPVTVCADALGWARSACPTSTLIINDFRTDQDYQDLLQGIVRQKGKFDAIGIQSHMHRGNWPLYQVWDTCERFKDLDAPIHFTEVTVLSGNPRTGILSKEQPSEWPSTTAGEIEQADYTEKFYILLFSHPSVQAITWWDLSDSGAWQGAPAGLLRMDMTKKPAYNRLLTLVRDKWWSRGDVYTGDDGIARMRGFYGTYKIVVEKEGKRTATTIHIAGGLDNRLKVNLSGYRQPPPTPLYEMIWPYILAAVIITLIVLIGRWIARVRRRI